jgi:hypothetical protein
MDEQQTLRLMAWTIGGLVGVLFFLNAVALSLVSAPQPLPRPEKGPLLIGETNFVLHDRSGVRARLLVGADHVD